MLGCGAVVVLPAGSDRVLLKMVIASFSSVVMLVGLKVTVESSLSSFPSGGAGWGVRSLSAEGFHLGWIFLISVAARFMHSCRWFSSPY